MRCDYEYVGERRGMGRRAVWLDVWESFAICVGCNRHDLFAGIPREIEQGGAGGMASEGLVISGHDALCVIVSFDPCAILIYAHIWPRRS